MAADALEGTGNTHPMLITTAMQRDDRPAPECVQAGTDAQLRGETVVGQIAELPVLGFLALVKHTRTAALIDLLRIKLGYPREVFDRAVSPVIAGYAEFVQLLPALAAQYQSNQGGLYVQALKVASRALDYRRGQILPRGAAPEVIGAQAHRWTYAVFLAALLHDVGKTLAGQPVLVRDGQGVRAPWAPLAGSMLACGAVYYRLELPGDAATQSALYAGVPLSLLNQVVPPSVLDWLAADPGLMRELTALLSGDPSARAGAISGLVLRAAAELGRCELKPDGRDDSAVEATAPATTPVEVDSENVADDLAATTVAPDVPGLSNPEAEYLEDVEEYSSGVALESRMLEPWVGQATPAARRFIDWLQRGLSGGTLRVNVAGALVHFVDEGMLLVSPRIFREFAERYGEDGNGSALACAAGEADIGLFIQRQVLRADWHLRTDQGVNFLTYQVMRGKRAVSRLSGVVIPNPARFVDPVPPVNPLLVRLVVEPGET
jgi:hypothetical protein